MHNVNTNVIFYIIFGFTWYQKNCPLENCPPRKLPSLKIPPYEYSPYESSPCENYPPEFSPEKIAPCENPHRPPPPPVPSRESYPQSNPLPTYKSYK